MKLLYISKAFEDNIGATMHYNALKELYGVENVYTIALKKCWIMACTRPTCSVICKQ